jgi:hypothetical protein
VNPPTRDIAGAATHLWRRYHVTIMYLVTVTVAATLTWVFDLRL